ncbi:MAG: hypothetical protein H0T83_09075 [Chthoniobacterales bacterium]|nr:hypothetical protein [Chthoniobacterales bacterium]
MLARHERLSLGRFGLALLLAVTILAAALLSSSPACHEQLHPDVRSSHLCVATLFATGQCDSAAIASIVTAPSTLSLLASLPSLAVPHLSGRHFFSLLEHAPPSLA